jgi:hypothetical protein
MTTYINPGNNTGLYGINDININTPYGNANVESFLATGSDTGGNIVGNIVAAGNITAGGNIAADYFIGDGSQLTNLPAGTYGNANVSAFLAAYGSNTIVTTGNITGGYIFGNGSQLTGIAASYGNSNVVSLLSSFGSNTVVTTGNITGGNFVGSGAALTSITGANVTGTVPLATSATTAGTANTVAGANVTGTVANATFATSAGSATTATSATTAGTVTTAAQPNITSVGTLTSVATSGTVSATGNITGNYFIGNGSLLTGITGSGTYGNANVAAFLPTYTGNLAGGNLNITNNITANVGGLGNITAGYGLYATTAVLTNEVNAGSLVTQGLADIGGELDVAGNILAPLSLISGGNLVATGTGRGFISATANISAGGNIISSGYITAAGNITSAGNIAASYFVGNGSQLTGITTTYGNANVAAYLPTYTGLLAGSDLSLTGSISATSGNVNTGSVNASAVIATGFGVFGVNPSGGVTTPGYIVANTVTANTSVTSSGTVSAVGNITGGNLITAALVQGATVSATGNVIGGNINTAGLVSATGSVVSGSTISAVGNITGGNLVTGGQLTATGNVTGGNVIINGSNLRSKNAWDANTSPQQARITVGDGYNNDFSTTYDPVSVSRGSQLAVINKELIGNADSNQSLRQFSSSLYADLNGGTLTNNNRRLQAFAGILYMGNGSQNMTSNQYTGASAGGGVLLTGNVGSVTMGNIQLGHGAGLLNSVLLGTGSNIGNSVASIGQYLGLGGTVGNAIGAASTFQVTSSLAADPTTVIGFYMPGSTSTYGINNSSAFRRATNYYFLKNDDDAAQNQLGSLRSYTEFNAVSGTTSGSLTIDKTAGQVQQVNLAGNISGITFSNFVSSASDGTNTDEQSDTVTVIFNQGSTGGYGVTFPSGSTYKYAGNITALQSTAANSVSLVSISAIRLSGTTTYLITISPGFV